MATILGRDVTVGDKRFLYLSVADRLAVRDIATILMAVDSIYVAYLGLYSIRNLFRWPAEPLLFRTPEMGTIPAFGMEPSASITHYAGVLHELGLGLKVHRIRIESPGIISIEGGQALGKIVDILHKGDLEREEKAVLIERIRAETNLINAQVVEKEVQTLAQTIALLKEIGYTPEEIRAVIARDPKLVAVVGQPIVHVLEMRASGAITGIRESDPDAQAV